MPELLVHLTDADGKVGVYPLSDYCHDVGRIDDLKAARSEFDSVIRS